MTNEQRDRLVSALLDLAPSAPEAYFTSASFQALIDTFAGIASTVLEALALDALAGERRAWEAVAQIERGLLSPEAVDALLREL